MRSSLLFALLLTAATAATAEPSLDALDKAARARVGVTARLPLADAPPGTPNYVRVLQATAPDAAEPLEKLFEATLFAGEVEPQVKMAMGLRIAQLYSSPYLAAHLERYMRADESGRVLMAAILAGEVDGLAPERRLAIRYAESLNADVIGVRNEQFRATRGYFNDSQIVELTLTVCFFNYFTRFVEGLHLPVEPWVLNEPWTPSPALAAYRAPDARVGLIADGEMLWAATQAERVEAGEGHGLPNSMRAMMKSPEIGGAWRAYWGSTRAGAAVAREVMLHVSFAVSMANGCRYCTLHQVRGLRRLGVKPSKLMQMKKDDSALSEQELAAVVFARKLTASPTSVTDADFAKLKGEFGGDRGALDVLMQTCSFAFMNRFTDGLRLPSEDDAIQIYRETYGGDFERAPGS